MGNRGAARTLRSATAARAATHVGEPDADTRSSGRTEVDHRRTVCAVGHERCLRISVSEVLAVRSGTEVVELAVREGEEDRRARWERARHLAVDRNAGLGLERQGGADDGVCVEKRRLY